MVDKAGPVQLPVSQDGPAFIATLITRNVFSRQALALVLLQDNPQQQQLLRIQLQLLANLLLLLLRVVVQPPPFQARPVLQWHLETPFQELLSMPTPTTLQRFLPLQSHPLLELWLPRLQRLQMSQHLSGCKMPVKHL